jgi:hypothetical protein
MPLKKSPNGDGSNDNGSRSHKHCSYCYQDGHFTQKDWSAEDMYTFVKSKMKEMEFTGFLASFFTKGISKLDCWKNNN